MLSKSYKMDIYYYIFFMSFVLCIFDFIKLKYLRFIPYLFFVLFLVFFVSNRQPGVDNDSLMYEQMFDLYSNSTYKEISMGGYGYVEKGYVLLNKIIGDFGGGYEFIFLIMALLISIFNNLFIIKRSPYPYISLLFYMSFYFLYRDFTQIRYALSCAIAFWAVYYYIKKQYRWMVLFLFLSISFHNAATILIPSLLAVHFIKIEKVLFLLPLPAILIGFSVNLMPILILSGLANDHMTSYLDEDGSGGLVVSIIGYFVMLLYYLVNYLPKKRINITNEELVYFKLLSFSVILNFMFIQSAIFQRFTLLLFQFSVLLLPILLCKMKIIFERKETFILLYFLFACFLLFYGIKMIDDDIVRPYRF